MLNLVGLRSKLNVIPLEILRTSLVAQRVKRLPSMQETWVRSLGGEDPLEKEMETPLQYSCLEISMDGEAWWATVHGVTKSRTRLSNFTHFTHFSLGQLN